MECGGISWGITNYRPAGKRVVSARNHRKNWKPKNSASKTARRNVRLQHGDQCQCSCGSVDTHPISGGESLRRSLQTGTDAAISVQPSQPERKQPGVLRVRHTRRVASLIMGENGNSISLLFSPISHTLPLSLSTPSLRRTSFPRQRCSQNNGQQKRFGAPAVHQNPNRKSFAARRTPPATPASG